MRHFFKAYVSNEAFYYIALDQISEIGGDKVIMTNGNRYRLSDYNMNKLKELMYRHECVFTDSLGHSWRPSTPMTEDR